MALEHLPVEIWQTILRYSISIPIFFDPDPIESNGLDEYTNRYDDDRIYWRSERHRNILRRVCSGWNAYLLQFNHRFVRLEDVWKDIVPAASLKQAIRLRYVTWSSPFAKRALEIVKTALSEDERWSLEILDGGLHEIDELILQSDTVERLQSLYTRDMKLPNIELWCPSIRLLDTTLEKRSTYEPLRLSRLTTLSILSPLIGVIACDFPSLKHLSIYPAGNAKLHPQDLVKLLKATGTKLNTFFDHYNLSEKTLPNEIWALCPSLKRIQTSLALELDTYTPPSLDSFQFSSEIFSEGISMDSSRLPINCLQRVGITKVIFRETWKIGIFDYPDELLKCVLFVMSHGLSLYDIRGIKFQDLIVTMLQIRNAKKRAPFPGLHRPIRWF